MLLKFLIVLLLLALIGSLGAGFYFLMIDQGDPSKRRLVNSLGVRVSIAAALMILIVYGVSTGKLRSNAPWERHASAQEGSPTEEAAPTAMPEPDQ